VSTNWLAPPFTLRATQRAEIAVRMRPQSPHRGRSVTLYPLALRQTWPVQRAGYASSFARPGCLQVSTHIRWFACSWMCGRVMPRRLGYRVLRRIRRPITSLPMWPMLNRLLGRIELAPPLLKPLSKPAYSGCCAICNAQLQQ